MRVPSTARAAARENVPTGNVRSVYLADGGTGG